MKLESCCDTDHPRHLEKFRKDFFRLLSFFRASGVAKTRQAWHVARIKALRGKYRHALTPSDEVARRKQEEIALERNRQ